MLGWLVRLFDTAGFPARWYCGTAWQEEPAWGWLHIASDLLIWGAYTAIPLVIWYFVRRRRDLPFPKIFWLFAAFIFACGTTHLIDALLFWWPAYRLSAVVRFATATVSWATVFALLPIVPLALSFRSPKDLEHDIASRTRELLELNDRMAGEVAIRQRTQEWLEDRERRLQLALSAGQMGTWEWDVETDALRLDPVDTSLLGGGDPMDFPNAQAFFARVHPEDLPEVRRRLRASLTSADRYDHEFRVVWPDGTVHWLVGKGVVRWDRHGRSVAMIGVHFDISEQKLFERELADAQAKAEAANVAKTQFLAQMSHEIRTPMAAILGAAQLLRDRDLSTDQRELVELLLQQADQLLGILNDILDISKIEAGKLEVRVKSTRVVDVVRDVCSLMAHAAKERGLELDTSYESEIPASIETDPLRVKQILLNLVSNAIKFTSSGKVTVRVRCDTRGPECELALAVEDTGIGIDETQLPRIFTPFHQAGSSGERSGPAGTGLGLAICRKLAELLGGTIEVKSSKGHGSTFTFRLPIGPAVRLDFRPAEVLLREPHPLAAAQVDVRFPFRVLVAEDTRAFQFLIRRMLEDVVQSVTVVSDGAEAVAAATKSPADSYDVILMDVQMPRMDGIQATRALRAHGIEVPIIALTAGVTAEERDRCLAAGCTDFVAKPLDRGRLIAALTRTLDAKGANGDGGA